ncbi:MAG: hypothetical protein ACOC80_13195 [Petrotogales bacterium]
MVSKITRFMKEYMFGLSIVTIIFGLFLLSLGILWFWFNKMIEEINTLDFIRSLGDWNAYVLVVGLIVFGTGIYYLYSYIKNKKFVLKELKTGKRSEFLKKHNELKSVAKHLPLKYQKMLKDREEQLKIK